MTQVIDLNASQLGQVLEFNLAQGEACEDAARRRAVAKGKFVFFAAFDGTNNDMDDLRGDALCTNVGQLWMQYRAQVAGHLQGAYYPGLGTRGRPTRETWMPRAVIRGVITTAEKAYAEFAGSASAWLAEHPRTSVSVVLAAFSRGCASAAIFSQLLYARGVASPHDPDKALIRPGKIRIAAGVLFDPVATGVRGNLALPPNARNVVVLKALNEYRRLFKAVDYTRQEDIATTLGFYGNHCDVGGSYDNGLAALTLDAATRHLRKSGLEIGDVPPERRLAEADIAVHSEECDSQGNRIWDVYWPDGFSFGDKREFDEDVEIRPASRATASGRRRFTLHDGERVTV